VLVAEPIADAPSGSGHALVRNAMTLIDSGYDLERVERSADEGVWLKLGRLAIGQVVRAGADGPGEGEWIYWLGPHADYASLDLQKGLWAPVPDADPLLLPAGIGAEAQLGVQQAIDALGDLPKESVVLGQGMLGHLAAQWLKAAGSSVSVVDNSPKRLEFSRKSGLKQKIDMHNLDWMEQLRHWHPGGVPLLVDATGAPPAIESLLPILRSGGVLGLLGQWRSRPLTATVGEQLRRLSAKLVGPAPALGDAAEHEPMLRDWIGRIHRGEIPTARLLTHHVAPGEGPVAVKRFAAGIRSWQGAVIHWDAGSLERFGEKE
jgi:threonine dehydrogenase-like Zn-dependent dehydrogenase